jgi:uridine kinase
MHGSFFRGSERSIEELCAVSNLDTRLQQKIPMPTTDAFLSYNEADGDFARLLYEQLGELGIQVWFAPEHRASSETWHELVAKAICESRTVIALFGPHGIGKEQKREINLALELVKKKKIELLIPVLIPNYDENRLNPYEEFVKSNYNRFDLREGLKASDLHALASTIKHDINPPPIPAEKVQPADSGGSATRRILSVSGGSGARTGTLCGVLADRLAVKLGSNCCRILSMERYYVGSSQTRSQTFTNRYGNANFDDPEIIDFDQLVKDVEQLRDGVPIQSPEYDKQAHVTSGFEPIPPPTHFVIIEGTYLLQDDRVRKLSDATIYVSVDPEIRFVNRVWKDVDNFKIPLPHVLTYYFQAVKPAFEKWVEPFKHKAKFSLSLDANYSHFDFVREPVHVPLNYTSAANKLMSLLKRDRFI